MKKFLAIGIGVLAFVALAVTAGLLMVSDDTLDAMVRPLPVIGSHAEEIVELKSDITGSMSHLVDDSIYSVKSTWRSITNFSLTDRTQRVVIELEPVRTKKPRTPKPPQAPPVGDRSLNQEKTGPTTDQMEDPAQAPLLAATDAPSAPANPTMDAMEAKAPPMPPAIEPDNKTMVTATSETKTQPPEAPPAPPTPKSPPVEMSTADRPMVKQPEKPKMVASGKAAAMDKKDEEVKTAAVQATPKMAVNPKPMRKPPPPAPKTDGGSAEHKKGLTFYKGIGGVAKNFKTAATWFRQSSAKGNAASQYNLGIMAYLGQGVDQSYEEAAKWFQQAANQDHALAQYNLGFLFYEGKGVEKDDLQAFMWIDRAARLGDEKAIKARDTLEKILPKDILKGR